MTFELAEHQRYAVNMMEGNEALAIYYEMGTGKTALALAYIKEAVMRGDIRNALIMCPAALVPNWRASIRKMADFGYTEGEIRVLESVITVISISSIWKGFYQEVHHRDGTVSRKRRYRINPAIDHPWDCAIIDEAHCLGDPESVQTRTALKLALMCKRRYIMTGTPDCGSGDTPAYTKLYGQIKFLKPDAWDSFAQWRKKYVMGYDRFNKPIRYDMAGCEKLKRQFAIVVRLRDCFDMPEFTNTVMECPLAETRAYNMIKKNKGTEWGIAPQVTGVNGKKLLQVCSGHVKGDDGQVRRLKSYKLDTLSAIINGTEDKVVVFCTFTASIDAVAARLDKERITYLTFDGRVSEPTWQRFQADPGIKVFVAQYQKGNAGVDLYASHTMVFYEPTQAALLLNQARARIMRKGQTHHCQYIHLVTAGTVEPKTSESVRNGVSVSNELLDEWARMG